MLTRRHFIISTAAMFSPALTGENWGAASAAASDWATWDSMVTPPNYNPAVSNPWGLESRFLPRRVETNRSLTPGDIHVDAVARYLYHIQDDGSAMRYGVAIGRGNLYSTGTFRIGRKAKWPSWTPTANMIRREPEIYAQFAGGQPPGPDNALGSRALYLYSGSRDTYLRIHGTPFPRSVGDRASSGCVRMVMAHINDMYDSVNVGSTVVLHPGE